jgi:hypothetical protein
VLGVSSKYYCCLNHLGFQYNEKITTSIKWVKN